MSFIFLFFFLHFWFNLVEVFFSVYFTSVFFFVLFFYFWLRLYFSMWFFWRATMIMIMNASHMHIMLSNRFRRKNEATNELVRYTCMESKYRLNFQKWWVCCFFLSFLFLLLQVKRRNHKKMTKGTRKPYGIQMRRFVDTLIF